MLEGLASMHVVGFGMIDLEPCMCAQCTIPGLYPANVELPKVSDVVLTCDLEVRNDSRILVVWVSSVEVMLCCGPGLRWYFRPKKGARYLGPLLVHL